MRKDELNKLLVEALDRPSPEKKSVEMDIAISIDTMRLHRNWSQKDLAKMVGTSQSAIARVESGRHTPSLTLIKKIAGAFGKILRVSFTIYLVFGTYQY